MPEGKIKLMSLSKADFEIQSYKGSGPGGQHRNKVETGIRITHTATGVSASSCEGRSQYSNKLSAFNKLTSDKRFLSWLKLESLKRNKLIPSEGELGEMIDRMMNIDNLKVEYYDKDKDKFIEIKGKELHQFMKEE